MELKRMPNLTMETIKDMEDMTHFTHALIFDDLMVVAQRETCCFVWKSADGLTVIDAIWPDKAVYDAVISAIRDVGWNPDDIKRLVLTHGHVDHTGCGKWFVKNHGAKTYLSEIDDRFWREHPTKPERPETWKDFDIDIFVGGGDTIDCGDKSIYICSTPGHTPGCLSYIFPVFNNGEKHMAAIFGGATPPWGDKEGTKRYLESLDVFMDVCREKGADVMLCNHTAFDNGLERMAYSAKRLSYMPNIYVLGRDGFEKFCEVFKAMGLSQIDT